MTWQREHRARPRRAQNFLRLSTWSKVECSAFFLPPFSLLLTRRYGSIILSALVDILRMLRIRSILPATKARGALVVRRSRTTATSSSSSSSSCRLRPLLPQEETRRWYFTNGDRLKKQDPYAILGLSWGDGSTRSDIQAAFRQKALELHPDVTQLPPERALQEFQKVQQAYETLMKAVTGDHLQDIDMEEWRFMIWRQSDRIAEERDDVAGVLKKRPAKPAESHRNPNWGTGLLGHPNGKGIIHPKRGEYLEAGGANNNSNGKKKQSSSVGTGQSKWVQRTKEFQPWTPSENNLKKASISSTKKMSSSSKKG